MPTQQNSSYQSARFTTRTHESSAVIVTVDGEVDFTNVDELIGAATDVGDDGSRVVLDLSAVEFFGSAGYSALHALHERYTGRAVTWAVVPSRNVDRVVRICDTASVVPLRPTITAALESA